jgi:hypothetical protein
MAKYRSNHDRYTEEAYDLGETLRHVPTREGYCDHMWYLMNPKETMDNQDPKYVCVECNIQRTGPINTHLKEGSG